MRPYHYTDKLLLVLLIVNIWMFVPSIWGIWMDLSFVHKIQSGGDMLTNVLLSAIRWLGILIFTTWAFFKKWRWVVGVYVLYLSRWIPSYINSLIEFWRQHDNLNFLDSTAYTYSYIFLWLLGLITLIVMLIETDYSNSFLNRWVKRES